MAKNATPSEPEPPVAELHWGDFFTPLDPDLVFECNSTVFGRYDSVCVYRHLIVIESPDDPGPGLEIPVRRISAWHVRLDATGASLTIQAGGLHVARVPKYFARALETALRDVLDIDPLLRAA